MTVVELTPLQNSVLAIIEGCASRGEQLPSNHALCKEVGCENGSLSGVLSALESKGHIKQRFDASPSHRRKRIVTILRSGCETAKPSGWSETIETTSNEFIGPCWRCGSRVLCSTCRGDQ